MLCRFKCFCHYWAVVFVFHYDPAWPRCFLLWNQIKGSSSTELDHVPRSLSARHSGFPSERWKASSVLYQLPSLLVPPKTKRIRSAKAIHLKQLRKKLQRGGSKSSHVLARSVASLTCRYIELMFKQLVLFPCFDTSSYFPVSHHCVLGCFQLLYLTELLSCACVPVVKPEPVGRVTVFSLLPLLSVFQIAWQSWLCDWYVWLGGRGVQFTLEIFLCV